MNEIVIKISDKMYSNFIKRKAYYEVVHEQSSIDPSIELTLAVINGKVLPKGHGRLIDIDKVVENEETFRKYFSITTHPLMNGKIINCIAPSVVEADKGEE